MSADPLVIVGAECRVPGADSWSEYRDLLMHGRTGYAELPPERGDRALYFHTEKGKPGKSYTTLGGVVPDPSQQLTGKFQNGGRNAYDPAHIHFADVVLRVWSQLGFEPGDSRPGRTGVYVGHSGGTRFGGDVSLAVQIEETLTFLNDVEEFRRLSVPDQRAVIQDVVRTIRQRRPCRTAQLWPRFEAYQAASLAGSALKLDGPRIVLDAACASSLTALSFAMLAIQAGRIDTAIVGGATYNSVDNLILFSQSQACTDRDSRPFDNGASGLVSAEGYVAIVVMRDSLARRLGLQPLAEVCGVGIASDGRGRSLWAPRKEGQTLALRRAYDGVSRLSARNMELLDIDYQEAHATSTQLGDATELETLHSLITESAVWKRDPQRRLPIGSAKSNIGHTLEAAGLLGIVKVLTAMKEKTIPPSLRFESPNQGFAWEQSRIDVITQPTRWSSPQGDRPRTAAVSAFGIGGLNAHVVVRDRSGSSLASLTRTEDPVSASAKTGADVDPIVIVGRGVVLPGARGIEGFESLMMSDQSAISEAPGGRWRNRTGVQASSQAVFATTPHCRAGYVQNFSIDGAKYRIPPRQAQQSNPLQMMFLDAVSQALEECSAGSNDRKRAVGTFQKLTDFDSAWPVGRDRTGVVIGTIFGGEFSDQLQADMRLPEIERELRRSLADRSINTQAEEIVERFRQTLLTHRPALLDETGSFTASTLASRIAKTFDLMGGACALDGDNASGLNALVIAVDQLQAGAADMVVCGAGTRALNLSLFELMDHQGRLVRSGEPEEIPADLSRVIPGEGAVVLLLCRRSTARQSGLRVLGTIQPAATQSTSAAKYDAVDVRAVRKLGYLAGAHSLVRVVAETTRVSTSGESSRGSTLRTIIAEAQDGQVVSVDVCRGDIDSIAVQHPESVRSHQADSGPTLVQPASFKTNLQNTSLARTLTVRHDHKTPMRNATNSLRLGAADAETMLSLIESLQRYGVNAADLERVLRPGSRESAASESVTFEARDRLRVALPNLNSERSPEERLAGVAKAIRSGRLNAVLEREQAVVWNSVEGENRVAWLFPGQGSHYAGVPSVFADSAAAKLQLEQIDAAYESVGSQKLSDVLHSSTVQVADDIWWSQSWGLGLSCCLTAALKEAGLNADVCLGHSLGEFSAAFAARVIGPTQMSQLARARSQAVMTQARVGGGLLSIRASAAEVDAVLRQDRLSVEISHLNSPRQTVIAGTKQAIAAAQKSFDARQIASMSVPVPAPFHTQLMQDAERMFESLSSAIPLRVPTTAVLSATSVRYLSEPQDVRNSLVRQLTRPVMFLAAIERLLDDDVRLFVEVGPNDILTRLTREIAGPRALCISADVPGQPYSQRLGLIGAAVECVTGSAIESASVRHSMTTQLNLPGSNASHGESKSAPVSAPLFDVTRRGRKITPESVAQSSPETVRPIATEPQPAVFSTKNVSKEVAASGAGQEPKSLVEVTAASSSMMSPDQIREYLRDLIVELTGYDPEIIENDSDLESDLGIDSIKRAQIFGELASWLGITVRPNAIRFDRVRTLNDAVALAMELSGLSPGDSSPQRKEMPAGTVVPSSVPDVRAESRLPVDSSVGVFAAENAVPVEAVPALPSAAELDGLLVAYVCDQTGYSPDVVDIDADLEADLGLDSIKLAQLIGEIRSQFSLQHLSREMVAQARFRTLREIREFLIRHSGTSNTAPETVASRPAAVHSLSGTNREPHAENAQRFVEGESLSTHQPSSQPVRGHVAVLERKDEASSWTQRLSRMVNEAPASKESLTAFGRETQQEIRETLRRMLPGTPDSGTPGTWAGATIEADGNHRANLFDAVAEGAGIDSRSLERLVTPSMARQTQTEATVVTLPAQQSGQITQRYLLRVIDAPNRVGAPDVPEFHGAALILGDNPLAASFREELTRLGVDVHFQSLQGDIESIEASLETLWQKQETPHLFLTMAFDNTAAQELRSGEWNRRRMAALEVPFRICQLWMQRMVAAGMMDEASVIAVTRLGGDFGFSGERVQSFEATGGLIKAMLIESWMRGFRTTPMKVVDASPQLSPKQIVAGVLRELAVPSYDMEIALSGPDSVHAEVSGTVPPRRTVQAIPAPLSNSAGRRMNPITRGGTWVVSGGGRGISAAISQELAARHGLKLRLLGTAPVPQLSGSVLQEADRDMSALRRRIMQQAASEGSSPIESWRRMEKAIEIHRTLADCAARGIDARYYCCDVAEYSEVSSVLAEIRRVDGRIHGVIHGAGFGQDARFDRKRPDKVRQCLKAKIDGTIALMEATMSDRLEWFVAFGSISGRFGANGHTDYSLANDMMAKIVDRYRSVRPEIRSVTFHWHAWGDIGMATKPEAKLALEMIDMRFMPATEGMNHFLSELEFGGDESEVLITDEEYFRKFFPADRLSSGETRQTVYPLVSRRTLEKSATRCVTQVTLHPVTDAFLSQHRVGGRPVLPFVVATEMMAETASLLTNVTMKTCLSVTARQAIRFATDDPMAVVLEAVLIESGNVQVRLLADVRRRDGRLVEEGREYFRAIFAAPSSENQAAGSSPPQRSRMPVNAPWEKVRYAEPEAHVWHGPVFQELRKYVAGRSQFHGRIAASAPVQLFGGERSNGFIVPCSTFDACLYLIGLANVRLHGRLSLPVEFHGVTVGRFPDPGEPCDVCATTVHVDDRGATWSFCLTGQNGDVLLNVESCRTGWLSEAVSPS